MEKVKVISSDSHVVEPPELWVDRMDKAKFGDRIPHLITLDNNEDWWLSDHKQTGPVGAVTQAGLRFERPEDIVREGSFADVLPGAYIPSEHVKDMDADGVYGGIVYPSIGLALYRDMEEQVLTRAIFEAYNDWLADFCRPFPSRLKGIAMILIDDDVPKAIAELKRTQDAGMVGAMISSHPRHDQTYENSMYEAFWKEAEELRIPLSLHVTTNRPDAVPIRPDAQISDFGNFVQVDYWVRMSLTQIIFSGTLEKYPELIIANVEDELSWIPFFASRMDFAYKERQRSAPYRFKNDAMPSDFMRSNVYHSFQEDPVGIQLRDLIGVDRLMWGSDYPHAESTFPKSLEILDEILEGVPSDEKALIVGGNAERLYGF